MFHVILHQLSQSGKLLPSIQVIVIASVLNLDVGDSSISSKIVQGKRRETQRVRLVKTDLAFDIRLHPNVEINLSKE